MNYEIITSLDKFRELKDAWQILESKTPGYTIFNTWIWNYNWFLTYGAAKDIDLKIIVVRADEQVIAIAPLYIKKIKPLKFIPLQISHLAFIGNGGDTSPDHLMLLLDKTCSDSVISMLVEIIGKELNWVVFEIDNFELGNNQLETILLAFAGIGCKIINYEEREILQIAFPDDTEDFYKNLTGNHRRQIAKNKKTISEKFNAKVIKVTTADELDIVFERLSYLHKKRWTGVKQNFSFSSRQYIDFHKRLCSDLLEAGYLYLYYLELDGVIEAVEYCFGIGDTVYYFQSGFNPDYSDYSIGRYLLFCILEEEAKRGMKTFDFLKGDYEYKRRLSNKSIKEGKVIIIKPTVSGKVNYLLRGIDSLYKMVFRKIRRYHLNKGF